MGSKQLLKKGFNPLLTLCVPCCEWDVAEIGMTIQAEVCQLARHGNDLENLLLLGHATGRAATAESSASQVEHSQDGSKMGSKMFENKRIDEVVE